MVTVAFYIFKMNISNQTKRYFASQLKYRHNSNHMSVNMKKLIDISEYFIVWLLRTREFGRGSTCGVHGPVSKRILRQIVDVSPST